MFQKPAVTLCLVCSVLACRVSAQSDYATPYVLLPFAGVSSYGHADGRGTAARFNAPSGLATDAAGNLYVSDRYNMLVRKITPGGDVTTLAGSPGVDSIQDGTGLAARFSIPEAIALDATGNIFVANQQNVIRKITPSGQVSTLPHVVQGANSLVFDPAGNLYFTQFSWHSIRRITPAGQLEEYAGQDFTSGTANGPRQSALFHDPRRLAADAAGNLYVADSAYFRKISTDGTVSSLPRILDANSSYSNGLAADAAGNLAVSFSYYNMVVQVSPGGQARILGGGKFEDQTYADGPALMARFGNPGAITFDRTGNIYVVDDVNNVIRKIAQGEVSTFAGMPRAWAETAADGRGEAARFSLQCFIARAPNGDLYVADRDNSLIRRVTADGTVTTIAGQAGYAGRYGMVDGAGAAARFFTLRGVATDAAGNCYVADQDSIRQVTPAGVVTTVLPARKGYYPYSLAVDAAGTIFFTDRDAVLRLGSDGKVETHAGAYSQDPSVSYLLGGADDGPRDQARFRAPTGLAFDGAGNLYVADTGNNTIRKITPAGTVSTLAGIASPGSYQFIDGPGAAARFGAPEGLTVDAAGNIYVGDRANNLIRKVTPAGQVTTLLGLGRARGNGAGLGAEARLDSPRSLAAAADGTLYLANSSQIYEAKPAGAPTINTQPLSQSVAPGGNVQLSVTASGLPAPTYQWHFNGNPFQGATSPSLGISNARAADAGDYTVVVTNALGSVTSAKATLTVTAAPVPPPPPSGGGGGGAPSAWFLLALASLGLARKLIRA